MPLFGSLDVKGALRGAPTMPDLHTDALTLERVDVLQVLFEIESGPMLELLPPALHPTLPPTVSFWVWRARGTDLGDFALAQVRIGCRAGVRPRGYLLSSICSDAEVAKVLVERWGYRSDPGTPTLKTYHDRVVGRIERDGEVILDVSMLSPEAISGGDVQYVATMHLANTPLGERLVQVDPEFTFHKADRGQPVLDVFDAEALGDARVVPSWPVSASAAVADVTLPKLRYVTKPDVPALAGTEPVL